MIAALICLAPASSLAGPDWSANWSANWSEGVPIPPGGRPNPYGTPDSGENSQYAHDVLRGKIHAQVYPVSVTGALPPYRPLAKVMAAISQIRSLDDLFGWIGMHPYPENDATGIYFAPRPDPAQAGPRMGVGLIETPDGTAFTLSCAECHSANLFGKTVLGMTNRFPRANETFVAAKIGSELITDSMLRNFGDATDGEIRMFHRLREHLKSVGAKIPATIGLDTSLAQVALSLARRNDDPYATPSADAAKNPRPEPLENQVADSKPAVWWNVKYKDRWLSDGSVVAGSPIFTNLLWNEIGRGGDLVQLENWFAENEGVIRELTSAVFSAEAPRFTDFFPPERLSLDRAKHGESIFNQHCAGCHGTYEKAWSRSDAASLSPTQLLETTLVNYLQKTFVVDVGTDPGRYLGMTSLERDLNPLEISQKNGIVIRAQKGYVPPPLVGIWARWPYFHNNSAPTLCAVLTRHEDRPSGYYAGEANDPGTDFDLPCNGYPENRFGWSAYYDTAREGMSNSGHDEGIFLKNGEELLTSDEKSDLIVFLQTL
ncbi:MAG: hypothetical protein P4M08_07555 [Oligoflexia bacterium]|nr:hypothetical protein [Oligoflexia bacterium]